MNFKNSLSLLIIIFFSNSLFAKNINHNFIIENNSKIIVNTKKLKKKNIVIKNPFYNSSNLNFVTFPESFIKRINLIGDHFCEANISIYYHLSSKTKKYDLRYFDIKIDLSVNKNILINGKIKKIIGIKTNKLINQCRNKIVDSFIYEKQNTFKVHHNFQSNHKLFNNENINNDNRNYLKRYVLQKATPYKFNPNTINFEIIPE